MRLPQDVHVGVGKDHVVVVRPLIWSRGKSELPLRKKDMPIGYPFGVVECTQQPHDP